MQKVYWAVFSVSPLWGSERDKNGKEEKLNYSTITAKSRSILQGVLEQELYSGPGLGQVDWAFKFPITNCWMWVASEKTDYSLSKVAFFS